MDDEAIVPCPSDGVEEAKQGGCGCGRRSGCARGIVRCADEESPARCEGGGESPGGANGAHREIHRQRPIMAVLSFLLRVGAFVLVGCMPWPDDGPFTPPVTQRPDGKKLSKSALKRIRRRAAARDTGGKLEMETDD